MDGAVGGGALGLGLDFTIAALDLDFFAGRR